jgi:4-hydroxybutyryl-CoA dehydratase / vinylacetyl-CoA-Delta-isomerase
MTHLNETIYATGIASSYQSTPMKSGNYLCDDMLANVCKHHVTRCPTRSAGWRRTSPAGWWSRCRRSRTSPSRARAAAREVSCRAGPTSRPRPGAHPPADREHDLGRNAVGYLTESLHGAGSPQAQRIQIARQTDTSFLSNVEDLVAAARFLESRFEGPRS